MRSRSNPWIFLNPWCANALLILFVVFVLVIDLIIITLHWSTSSCSDILKLWIIGKYFAPFLSYLSCCLFVPCNYDETMEVTTNIPYSQHERRQNRIRQNVLHLNPISQIRKTNHKRNPNHAAHATSDGPNCCCCDIPYPFDIMLSEWFTSPSTITANIAESTDTSWCCKIYIYLIGIVFDRGILELMWLFVGGLCVITEDASCRSDTPILFYYVLLQIILGSFITMILILWMISSSLCPLQVARLMACCYGMECDILGLLPQHLFQRLLTMHNNLRNETQNHRNRQNNKNYHTLSTIPHHYEQLHTEETVELATATINDSICAMCDHKMEYLDDGECNSLECGHQFHSVCIDAWPMNQKCPHCSHQKKQHNIKQHHRDNNNKHNSEIYDSDEMVLEPSIQLL